MKIFVVTFLLVSVSFANNIYVTIHYGGKKADKKVYTTYESGETTALELLQKVAVVKVAKGKYKFANSVDGVQAIVRSHGWFYMLDGKSTKKMASDWVLTDEKEMQWSYKRSACY